VPRRKSKSSSFSQVETATPTQFVGYEKLESPAKVIELLDGKDKTAVILDTSPFYAEMGGQVGDTGEMEHGAQSGASSTHRSRQRLAAYLRSQKSEVRSQK